MTHNQPPPPSGSRWSFSLGRALPSAMLALSLSLSLGACKPGTGDGPATGGRGGDISSGGRGGAGPVAGSSGGSTNASGGSGGSPGQAGSGATAGTAGGTAGSSGQGGSRPADPPAVDPPAGAEPPEPRDLGGESAAPSGDTLTVAAAGDIAAMGGDQQKTAAILKRLLAEKKLASILMLGDGAYRFSNLTQYRALYDPTWGVPELKSITRPIPGNHEYLENGNANGYFDYWNGSGAADGPAGPRGLGYYSFELGAWHVIALNTNEDCRHLPCGEGSAQLTWLRADLARNAGKRCTLVMVHHPRYQNGTHRGDTAALAAAWNAMVDANVDLVLASHEHNYQQFAPMDKQGNVDRVKGVRSFVVGTGGGRDFRAVFDTAQMAAEEKRIVNTSGVLELTLAPTGFDWKFHTVDGAVGAMGNDVCH